jgi:hypothetical protein
LVRSLVRLRLGSRPRDYGPREFEKKELVDHGGIKEEKLL